MSKNDIEKYQRKKTNNFSDIETFRSIVSEVNNLHSSVIRRLPYEYKLEYFVQKSKKVHGNKYDYSKVNYNGVLKKVTIICPQHGEFEQSPSNHLSGQGCSQCGRQSIIKNTSYNTEQLIKKAIQVHGDKYYYSKVDYKNSQTKVTVICPIHGGFRQTPNVHLGGGGCKKCSINKMAKNNTMTTKQFVERAIQIHGNKYDYSKVKYTGTYNKVIIICPIHGKFEQKPNGHLNGRGCPKCGVISSVNNRKDIIDKDRFIHESKKIHGNKYDYSNVVYKDKLKKVTIVCPKHGKFRQQPKVHLKGHGCPTCNSSKGELKIKSFLENNNIKHTHQYKVNINDKNYFFDFFMPDYNIFI